MKAPATAFRLISVAHRIRRIVGVERVPNASAVMYREMQVVVKQARASWPLCA